jgi:hypothetical protein
MHQRINALLRTPATVDGRPMPIRGLKALTNHSIPRTNQEAKGPISLVGWLVGELKTSWLVEPTKRPKVQPGCLVGWGRARHTKFQKSTKRPKVQSAWLVDWRLEDAGGPSGPPRGRRGTAGEPPRNRPGPSRGTGETAKDRPGPPEEPGGPRGTAASEKNCQVVPGHLTVVLRLILEHLAPT